MTVQILDGKELQTKVFSSLRKRIKKLKSYGITPCLVTIIIGNNPASKSYVGKKLLACTELGIKGLLEELPETISERELLEKISIYNMRDDVHGILIQKPFPVHIHEDGIVSSVATHKDVDGFHPENIGLLALGAPRFVPCTPLGCMHMLETINTPLIGKHVVIVGRSILVGKPLALLLINKGATVTVCNSKTENLQKITKGANILIVAIGKPKMITREYVQEGSIVLDVGITKGDDGKIVGDVDFESVRSVANVLSPVPNGVGPMTIAMLMQNTVLATEMRIFHKEI